MSAPSEWPGGLDRGTVSCDGKSTTIIEDFVTLGSDHATLLSSFQFRTFSIP
jgi:hypothetical protein